jgi:hypothetical protein
MCVTVSECPWGFLSPEPELTALLDLDATLRHGATRGQWEGAEPGTGVRQYLQEVVGAGLGGVCWLHCWFYVCLRHNQMVSWLTGVVEGLALPIVLYIVNNYILPGETCVHPCFTKPPVFPDCQMKQNCL